MFIVHCSACSAEQGPHKKGTQRPENVAQHAAQHFLHGDDGIVISAQKHEFYSLFLL